MGIWRYRQLRGSTKVYSYESENPENVIVAAAKSLWRKLTGQVSCRQRYGLKPTEMYLQACTSANMLAEAHPSPFW